VHLMTHFKFVTVHVALIGSNPGAGHRRLLRIGGGPVVSLIWSKSESSVFIARQLARAKRRFSCNYRQTSAKPLPSILAFGMRLQRRDTRARALSGGAGNKSAFADWDSKSGSFAQGTVNKPS